MPKLWVNLHRKGIMLSELSTAFMLLVVGVLVFSISALILNGLSTTVKNGSACNEPNDNNSLGCIPNRIIQNYSLGALSQGSSLMPVVGIIIVASVIISSVYFLRA